MKTLKVIIGLVAMIVFHILAIRMFTNLLLPDGVEIFYFCKTMVFIVDAILVIYMTIMAIIDSMFPDEPGNSKKYRR